jgi:hypothetical protein
LIFSVITGAEDQKIAAFGSSYTSLRLRIRWSTAFKPLLRDGDSCRLSPS